MIHDYMERLQPGSFKRGTHFYLTEHAYSTVTSVTACLPASGIKHTPFFARDICSFKNTHDRSPRQGSGQARGNADKTLTKAQLLCFISLSLQEDFWRALGTACDSTAARGEGCAGLAAGMGGAWTYSAGYPVLRVSTGGGGVGSRLTITQVRRQTVPFSSSVSS